MSSGFTSRNCCAVFLAAAVVGLMIAAAVAPWYTFQQNYTYLTQGSAGSGSSAGAALTTTTTNLNSTNIYYDLTGVKTEVITSGVTTSNTYNNYTPGSNVRNTTKTSQAFVLIALIGGFILLVILFTFFFDRIRNKLIFAVGMTVTRLIAVAFAAIIVISVIIAFLVYIGITQSFKNDTTGCTDGPCRDFVDSESNPTTQTMTIGGVSQTVTVTQGLSWGPIEGWYITLATTLPALLLLLIIVINKFPLPIDSEASSGEAL